MRILLLLTAASIQFLLAQDMQYHRVTPERGLHPNGTFSLFDIESIDNVTGNLSLTVPIIKSPPGRAGFSLPVSLHYSSAMYDDNLNSRVTVDFGPPIVKALTHDLEITNGWPWSYSFDYEIIAEDRPFPNGPPSCQDPARMKAVRNWLRMPDGSRKLLHYYTSAPTFDTEDHQGDGFYRFYWNGLSTPCGAPSLPPTLNWYTTDGSYIRLEVPYNLSPCASADENRWTIYFPDGRRVVGGCGEKPNTVYDRFGNKVTLTEVTSGADVYTYLTDDLARQVVVKYGTSGETSPDIITTDGFSEAKLTAKVYYALSTFSGMAYGCTNRDPGLSCEICPNGDYVCLNRNNNNNRTALSLRTVSRVELPRPSPSAPLSEYQFKYNDACPSSFCWGELRRMSFLTGSTTHYRVDYQYKFDGQHRTGFVGTWDYAGPDILDNPVTQRKLCFDATCSGIFETTSYDVQNEFTTITAPSSAQTTYHFTYARVMSYPFRGLVHRIVQPQGSTIDRLWRRNKPFGSIWPFNPGNPYVRTEVQGAGNGSSPSKCAVSRRTVDKNGNTLQLEEFDWKNPSDSSCATWAGQSASLGTPLRTIVNEFAATTAAGGLGDDSEAIGDDPDAYWRGPASPPRHYLQALTTSRTYVGASGGAVAAAISNEYTEPTGKAHRLKEWRWDSTLGSFSFPLSASNAVSTSWTYTNYGDVKKTTTADGRTSEISYDTNNLCPASLVRAQGQTEARTFSYNCDSYTTLLTSITDNQNSTLTTLDYDSIGRQKLIVEAQGSGDERKTQYDYDDQARKLTVKDDLNYSGDTAIQSIHSFDGLGRLILTEKTDPEGVVKIERAYRYSAGFFNELVSRPYRTGSEVTMGWTRTRYDGLGRVANVSSFGGNTKPAPWVGDLNHRGTTAYSYVGDMTTLQDAVGVQRRTTTDALGRLAEVMEANDAPGTVKYCYDVLDNLVAVHHATQVARDTLCAGQPATRTFTYSSLSRLLSATNPESGTTTFAYDKDGNLLRRNQPGGLVTCMGTWNDSTCSSGYDNLGRLTKKTYSDATPAVTYVYDQATLGKGLLYSVTTPHSETFFPSYNRLGRPTASQQKTLLVDSNWQVYDFSYSYFLSGDLKTIAYPSGRTITYSLNAARNTTGIISQSKTYMSGAKYWPDGNPDRFLLGTTTSRWQHLCMNDMGQTETVLLRSAEPTTACPAALSSELFRLDYAHETRYGTTKASDNNGNVRSQRIQRDTTAWNQTFTYDSRNRLEAAVETGGWQQAYKYDFHGNRAVIANQTNYFPSNQTFTPSVPSSSDSVSTIFPNNQWTGNSYTDQRGNVNGIASSTHTFTYDAEDRNTQAVIGTGGGAVTVNYAYDGDGRRVRRVQGSQRTLYVYDAFGRLATEYGSGGGTATRFLVSDPIGSTRQILNSDGTTDRCHDYLPFGEEIKQNDFGRGSCFGSGVYPNNQDTHRLKFSSKERDAESGLDYFGARYFSGAQGRFTSVDPEGASASLFNPQSWNAYSYTLNNPLKYVDPDGEVPVLVTGAIGAGVGLVGGAVFNAGGQLLSNGFDFGSIDLKQVGSAALGGALQGGLAGLTLGVGTAAVGIGEAALANGAANVIGGIVTRGTNELLGVPPAPNAPSEATSVAVDFAMGTIGGGLGARHANVRYPLPNVRRELAIIAQSNRRSLRPAKAEAFNQYANQQQIRNTVSGSVIGTSAMGFFTDLFFRAGSVFNPPPVQAKKKKDYETDITITYDLPD